MITKSQIKLVQSLKNSRGRSQEGLFVVEGVKMVGELLSSPIEVNSIFATSDWEMPGSIKNIPVNEISDWELVRISSLTTPNKVLAVASIPEEPLFKDMDKELVVMLDQISDPGNMGTIIRTAEWFGLNRVIAVNNSVDFWNPKVVQASMGSIFRMKLNVTDPHQFFEQYTNLNVYGTFLDGTDLGNMKLPDSGIIVIGNESHGISSGMENFITNRVTIPAASTSSSESLNASVAAAIVFYEFHRQSTP